MKCELTDWNQIEKDWALNKDKYMLLDTETTGLGNDDEIIQLSIIDLDGNILYNKYFKPTKDSHWAALKIHKISKAFLCDKPTWTECWNEIYPILKDRIILIHNDEFDKRLIKQTCLRYGVELNFELTTICTMAYTEHKYSIRKLERVIEFLKVDFNSTQLHNALIDCFMCLHVVNPGAEVFKSRRKAEEYFNLACNYKIAAGDKNGREKGYDWLKKEFGLQGTSVDFNYFDLRICNQIIDKLQAFARKVR